MSRAQLRTTLGQVIYRLLRPLRYLTQFHYPTRFHYHLTVPVALTLIATVLILPNRDATAAHESVDRALQLLRVLTGFFVAGLTAIASLKRKALDDTISGDSPPYVLKNSARQPLTRRQFLAGLFGYLAFLSFSTYLFGIYWIGAVPMLAEAYPYVLAVVQPIATCVVHFIVMNIFVNSLVGLFYFSEQLHRPDNAGFKRGPPS